MQKYVKAKKEIKAKSLTLYFNYTFLFSSFNLESLVNKIGSEDELNGTISLTLNLPTESIKIFSEEGKFYKEKIFDHYLAPFLYLKMSYIEISHSILNDQNEEYYLGKWIPNKEDIDDYTKSSTKINYIKRKIFLMESGQGTECIEVNCTPPVGKLFSSLDIVYLSNIGMRRRKFKKDKMNRQFSEYKLIKHDSEFFLFDFFFEDITNLKNCLNTIVSSNENIEKSDDVKFKWIETDSKYKLAGDVIKYKSNLHFQDPFPVISVTVSDDIYADCFLDEDQRKAMYKKKTMKIPKLFESSKSSMNKELLMLIYMSKLQFFQDISFAIDSNIIKDYKLVNMCSNSAVFLHLYSRSGLIVRTENAFLINHAEYIIPAFIETIQYLRMRWHAYVVASQWLEKIIEYLAGDKTAFSSVLKMIIDSRRVISGALSDPLAYRIGSGSMNKIYGLGLNIFRIPELQNIVIEKFSWIETLYNNIFQMERVNKIELLDEELRKLKKQSTDNV